MHFFLDYSIVMINDTKLWIVGVISPHVKYITQMVTYTNQIVASK